MVSPRRGICTNSPPETRSSKICAKSLGCSYRLEVILGYFFLGIYQVLTSLAPSWVLGDGAPFLNAAGERGLAFVFIIF